LRSVIDWLSDFFSQKRNPYLRLSEADRTKMAIRTTVFLVV
jgi:hypothetical protein